MLIILNAMTIYGKQSMPEENI